MFSVYGICEGLPAGPNKIDLRIGQLAFAQGRKNIGDAYLGWNSVERMIAQEIRLGNLYSSGTYIRIYMNFIIF